MPAGDAEYRSDENRAREPRKLAHPGIGGGSAFLHNSVVEPSLEVAGRSRRFQSPERDATLFQGGIKALTAHAFGHMHVKRDFLSLVEQAIGEVTIELAKLAAVHSRER
jgi:hypothetical protein